MKIIYDRVYGSKEHKMQVKSVEYDSQEEYKTDKEKMESYGFKEDCKIDFDGISVRWSKMLF